MILALIILERCIHDKIQPTYPPIPLRYLSTSKLMQTSRQKMRIIFDLSFIENGTDTQMCTYAGQQVSWYMGNFTCRQDDVLNQSRIAAIKSTLSALNSFLTSAISVTPLTDSIAPTTILDIPAQNGSFTADFYMTFVSRPFGPTSSTTAGAMSGQLNPSDNRPITGGCYINPAKVPTSAQSHSSVQRTFFNTLYHETMHALGLSQALYSRWINPNTSLPYGSSLPLLNYTNSSYPGKFFLVLSTPKAKEFVENRFGVSEFVNGVPAGIELEDAGGSGTEISHPKSRVYFTEVFAGVSVNKGYISELTFALLEDTGWYTVDRSYAESFPWGLGSSMGESKLTTFINSPPQTSFPSHYFCKPGDELYQCFYDYSGPSVCSQNVSINCSATSDSAFCSAKNFYNPLNYAVRGTSAVFDYMIVKNPYYLRQCADESLNSEAKVQLGEIYGAKSKCAMSTLMKGSNISARFPRCYSMVCDIFGRVYITVGSESKRCESGGQRLSFSGFGGYVECPPPKHICGVMGETDTVMNKMEFLIIALAASGAVIVISMIVCVVHCRRLRGKRDTESKTVEMPLNVV